ncbi:MAG: T9SS type A sorting domain-containing protein [Bacteroidota bacterium]
MMNHTVRQVLVMSLASFGFFSLKAQSIPNGGFETFDDVQVDRFLLSSMFNDQTCENEGGSLTQDTPFTGQDRPVGFRTTDDFFSNTLPTYVFETDEAFAGQSALRLQDDGFFGFGIVGLFEVETLVQETLPVDFPFEQLPEAVEGHYRHESGNSITVQAGSCTSNGVLATDSTFTGGFAVYAEFFDADSSVVAVIDAVFPDADVYTPFRAEVEVLVADVVPTQVILVFSSCPEFQSPNVIYLPGSNSYLDEVDFVYGPSSLETIGQDNNQISIFPNPVSDWLNLEQKKAGETSFEVLDTQGKRMYAGLLTSTYQINVNDWPKGIYILKSAEATSRFVVK